MVRKYEFGKPYNTESCVIELPRENGGIPYFTLEQSEKGLSFHLRLEKEDAIYGLGENVRGINKRGYLYRSDNVDDAPETEGKSALYASHNFLVFKSAARCFGVFFDDPAWFEFDLGFSDPDEAVMTSRYGDLSVYVIDGESVNAVVQSFHKLIGRSYLPPKWAFGYIQSRFGEVSESYISETLQEYEKLGVPIDGYCIDIDGLDEFQNFTWHKEKFPDPARFVKQTLDRGVHLIPIVDVAIRQDERNEDYRSGKQADVFCKGSDGKEFVGYVWPGKCVFPDFFQKSVQKWFGHLYQRYLDMGVHGFWNDMNEPSIFASEDGFRRAASAADEADREYSFLRFGQLKEASALLYDPECDTANFCHRIGGELVPNERVHNLYGGMMSRAAEEGFHEYDENTRFLLFTRSSSIGSHRYTGVWLGDNHSWWSHLLLSLKMLPSMNMCGYLFTGADIGGFNGDTTDELMLRWLQLGVFMPLMRNHSAWGTRKQELWRFSRKKQMAETVRIRYAMIPYLYSEFMKAALRFESPYRPLAFDYPDDERACRVEDQIMLGHECMIAPVYEQNDRGRYVYLPEDMLMLRMRSATDYEEIRLKCGDHYIDVAEDQLIFFVKKNTSIPLATPAEHVKDIDYSTIRMLGWLERPYSYELYDDDGLKREISADDIRAIGCELQ